MGKILTRIMLTIVAATALVACNTTGCIDNGSSLPLAGFYSSSTKSKITINSLTIGGVGAKNDSLIINKESASQAYLPFRADRDHVEYFIRYGQEGIDDDEHNDTIRFNYESFPYFASEECGAMFRYRIKSESHTSKFIESVEIVDSLVTNVDLERIHIFFRTVETEN